MQAVKTIYVLDACELLELAQDEPGADQVEKNSVLCSGW
jgi:hypothetical protein